MTLRPNVFSKKDAPIFERLSFARNSQHPILLLSGTSGPTLMRWIELSFVFNRLAIQIYRDGDWGSGKIAIRSPRAEPTQSSLPT